MINNASQGLSEASRTLSEDTQFDENIDIRHSRRSLRHITTRSP